MKAHELAALACGLALGATSAAAQDYSVQPAPPNFTQDANTTFLVNLTTVKSNADYSVGSSALTLNPANFEVGEGYTGPIGISTPGNWPTIAWTVEMLIRVPYQSYVSSSNNNIGLIDWRSTSQQCSFDLFLDAGWGAKLSICSWNAGNGAFSTIPFAGGNGYTVQNAAQDEWVYIAGGCDFVNHFCMVTARSANGAILNSNISFAPSAGAANSAAAWSNMQRYFTAALPSTLNIGTNFVQIRAIKLSNLYRTNLFTVSPAVPVASSTNFLPSGISPSTAQTRSITRNVGYPGYFNYIAEDVTEAYLELTNGSAPISIQLTNLTLGLYTLYVWGTIAPQGRSSLPTVWRPCPMAFSAYDASSNLLTSGQMLLKQGFSPRLMQGFSFHLDNPTTNVKAFFSVPANAMEYAQVLGISLFNQMGSSPMVPVKTAQTLAAGPTNQYTSLPSGWQATDDAIWYSLPPLNIPFETGEAARWLAANPTTLDTWVRASWNGLQHYQQPAQTFSPLDMLDTTTGTTLYQSNVLNSSPFPGNYPDSGWGVFYAQSNYPSLSGDVYETYRANVLGDQYVMYMASIVNSQGSLYGLQNARQYFNTGIPSYGHDAGLALVRFAYDYPALEMSLQQPRECTTSLDPDYGTDWSYPSMRDGKLFYNGWSGTYAEELFTAYDQVFPYINGNQLFANEVHRYVPWVNTPQDAIKLVDNFLVFPSVRDVSRGLVDASAGVPGAAGMVLGPSPYSAPFFDLTHLFTVIYPSSGGTYQEMYGTALSRSGTEYIGSFTCYGFGSAVETINQSYSIYWAKNAGVTVPMDLSNTNTYPKVSKAVDYLINMWVAGGFPFMIGDASGGPHSSLFSGQANAWAVLGAAGNQSTLVQVWQMWHDPRYAWLLKNLWSSNSADIVAAAAAVNPVLTNASRVVPDWGAVIEATPAETNLLKKTAATIRLGIGQGHVHSDYLDLNLFGFGVPLAVDLACRNEGTDWSLPQAGAALVHNHAMAGSTLDPAHSASQSGEPWLKAFAPPLVRACYNDGNGSQLDRHTFVMQIGTSNLFYVFDNQWLSGSTYHTWCFHGCESSDLAVNVPMSPLTTRFTGTTYPGSQYVGPGTNVLQAVWTMTRSTQSFVDGVDGGTFTTVACEPTVLGTNYNAALPPVQVRATLLGRANDTVLQGNPYSAAYQYCFPFLWSQTSNETASVYPAVYDWYRGAPFVSNIVLLATNPVRVQVSAAAQTDTYECATNYFLAVSRDTSGVRYVKLNGYDVASLPDLTVNPAPDYAATITAIDYRARTLTTSSPLPANPLVTVGNSGRLVSLQLYGSGTTFSFNDDLLVAEGRITSLHVASPSTIAITLDRGLLFDGCGNRHSTNMVLSTEDGSWHFRNNRVIASPVNTPLTTDVFTDANGDGLIDAKLYEIGEGDVVALPVDITIQRSGSGWSVRTNVPVTGSVNNSPFSFSASGAWQFVGGAPSAPTLLGGVPGP